jgi:hypothetical protein
MQGQHYKLNTDLLAIKIFPNSKGIPVTVPEGAVVRVVNGPLDGTRLVDVEWDGEQVMMFTMDLQERASLIYQALSSVSFS